VCQTAAAASIGLRGPTKSPGRNGPGLASWETGSQFTSSGSYIGASRRRRVRRGGSSARNDAGSSRATGSNDPAQDGLPGRNRPIPGRYWVRAGVTGRERGAQRAPILRSRQVRGRRSQSKLLVAFVPPEIRADNDRARPANPCPTAFWSTVASSTAAGFFDRRIKLGAGEHDVGAEVEPHHQDHHRAKRAIGLVVGTEAGDVE
jgi:hypothetical protein